MNQPKRRPAVHHSHKHPNSTHPVWQSQSWIWAGDGGGEATGLGAINTEVFSVKHTTLKSEGSGNKMPSFPRDHGSDPE